MKFPKQEVTLVEVTDLKSHKLPPAVLLQISYTPKFSLNIINNFFVNNWLLK